MSLTRTTVKKLGSFEVTTRKTTHLAPPTPSHTRSTGKRSKRKKKTSPILSYESDLNSVLEEDSDYSFTQNFSAIHEIPRTIPSPAPRPIRSALKSNSSQQPRKYSTGSRVSFSSLSSTTPSVSQYVSINSSGKNADLVDSDSSSGNSVYSDASEFLPPVIVDIVNNQRIIMTPSDVISPPSSQYSPTSSSPHLTAQQRRRSTYSTNERVSEYLKSKNGTKNETESVKVRPIFNKSTTPKKKVSSTDYNKHVLKRTPSNSSFERERAERRGATKRAGGFKLKTMRETNQRPKSEKKQQISETSFEQQQPHVVPFRSRFEDSDSDVQSEVSVLSGPTPVTKQRSPIARRFSLRSSDRQSVPEPVRLQITPKQPEFAPIKEEELVKPVKKKKFQQLRRVFGLL